MYGFEILTQFRLLAYRLGECVDDGVDFVVLQKTFHRKSDAFIHSLHKKTNVPNVNRKQQLFFWWKNIRTTCKQHFKNNDL